MGYALFYFTRKSFNAAAPEILASGILSRSDIGLLATLFYITYGVSKFVSGIVSDRSNARYFMGIGLIATGVVNILFGFSTSLWAFALLWALNAFFQGFGSPVCARLLTAWYSRTERGGWWALWNTAHNVGGALIPLVMAAVALHYGWRVGMIGLGFSITYGVGKTLVSYYADGKNTKQFLPFMLILSAICMLGFSASMGAGSTSLFLMIAFYALSGFFQSTGGSCSYSTITKWTPRRKRGTFLGFWNISHNLGGAGAAGVALFGANYLFDGHVIGMFIFPSIIALIVGFIGLRFGSDSPESYGLGKAEELFGEEISEEDKETEENEMTKWQIFVEYVLKNKVIWLLCFSNIFLYVVRIGIDQWSTVYAFQELKLSKEVAIQGFTLFEVGALVGTLLWGWLSDLANGRRALVACVALALIIATLGVYQHASNQYVYLASLFALGFLVFGPQLLIGVAAVGFVPKKAIGAADGIKGTFAYLIGDSFAKLGLGMIADGTPVFGLTGWAGTFAALDAAAIGCICLMAMVAVMEERKIRREKKIQQVNIA
ncbi:hexose-6-phosphate:phosphate antiporter [Salmonella enterica]|nr:hexose-6-phosphate:phosphate antiporter [Salmonella enterica]